MVGLGRMGANMTRRLIEHGHEVVAHDRDADAVKAAAAGGAQGVDTLDAVAGALEPPRAVWLMLPAGGPTDETVGRLAGLLAAGDTVVDGGNANYHDSIGHGQLLAAKGIGFVDAGVSGGVWGLKVGYCLMVGGDEKVVRPLEPIFTALAPENGYLHVGPTGAGHFVKMIHNGIEYGMLQAYAEGFALLDAAGELSLDLHAIAELWNHGSVVRSWLLELAELALRDPEEFSKIKGYVEDSGEGRWTVLEAVERGVAAPVITESLYARFSSQHPDSFGPRMIAALRNQFGGHRFQTEQ